MSATPKQPPRVAVRAAGYPTGRVVSGWQGDEDYNPQQTVTNGYQDSRFLAQGVAKSGATVRSRSSPHQGGQAFLNFLRDPVGGLPGLCDALGAGYACGLGMLFCIVYNLCALLGFVLVMSSLFNGILGRGLGGPLDWQLDQRPFRLPPGRTRPAIPANEQALLMLKFLGLALLPMISLAASIAMVRLVTRGRGNFGFDVLCAGAVLLPLGLFSPLAGLLGPANAEVVFFLSMLALCLALLILNSAFTRVVGLSDQGVILAIPVTVILTIWLCKVAVTSILFR